MGADQIRATVVASLAENTADAAVGALFWAALLGPGGAAAYTAANTLDAMFDPADERYAEFGWAAERLNAVLNRPVLWLTGALTVVSAPLVGGTPAQAARYWLDGGSPRVEGAFNGALGLDGTTASTEDVRRAVRLSLAVGASAALTCALIRKAAKRR
jgi:adenosylcobinamide-phosphate synthase